MPLKLRLAEPRDTEAMLAIYAPFVRDTAVSFEYEPPRAAEFAARVQSVLVTLPWIVAEDGPDIAGYAYATPFRARAAYRWAVEVTVYVAAAHRGRGAGKRLYRALLEALRLLGYRTVFGVITLPNPASVALHESLGFGAIGVQRRVGFKLGRWHDTGWWQLMLSEREDPPAEPRAIGELVATEDWRQIMIRAGAEP